MYCHSRLLLFIAALPTLLVAQQPSWTRGGNPAAAYTVVNATGSALDRAGATLTLRSDTAGTSMFGLISASQQIFAELYGLGPLFPVAFAGMAGFIAVGQFINSRIVRRFGMRRLAHTAILVYVALSAILLLLATIGPVPFPLFFGMLLIIQFMFGWAASNMNSLSMEPLGAVAGTASSVFGFLQTAGGAAIGACIGYVYDGTVVPVAAGFFFLGLIAIGCVLVAERGKLFGTGHQYAVRK